MAGWSFPIPPVSPIATALVTWQGKVTPPIT
jgi:hypothetical protein